MKRYLSLFFLAILVTVSPIGEVFARGGGGRGGGGGGRGGGGRGGPGSGGAAARAGANGGGMGARGGTGAGGRNGKNNDKKEQEETARREERMARVAEARLLYAKRERERMWESETDNRFGSMLARVLGGSTD